MWEMESLNHIRYNESGATSAEGASLPPKPRSAERRKHVTRPRPNTTATRRRHADSPRHERKVRKILLLSEKEACLRKLIWQERAKRTELDHELERCRRHVVKLQQALRRALEQRPEVATTDPYLIFD